MKRLAVDLGLEGHVDFAGWAGDERVGELLATADVGLAPDPRSPLNDASTMIKVAEYMSMSLPCGRFRPSGKRRHREGRGALRRRQR